MDEPTGGAAEPAKDEVSGATPGSGVDTAPLRDFGIALVVLGLAAAGLALVWNLRHPLPTQGDFELAVAEFRSARSEKVESRTSMKRYVVIEVIRAGRDEQWVVPYYSGELVRATEALEAGSPLTAKLDPAPARAQWTQSPVRMLWSLQTGGRDVISESWVRGQEKKRSTYPPSVGLGVAAVGAALLWLARSLGARRSSAGGARGA